jgi:hypothetical protein
MKTNLPNNEIHESTYAMLVRSEDKERSLFETVVYGLFILSSIAAIWQFALQPVDFPRSATPQTAVVAQTELVSQS